MGNEKAINQLIAHHSIIFKPEELKVWVSTAPFQLGEYICYDLNKVFIRDKSINKSRIYYENDLTIPADTFLYSNDYKNFNLFKEIRTQIQTSIKTETRIADEDYLFNEIIELNPEFFETYVYLGDYFNQFDINDKAILAYKKALRKEIPNIYQREKLLEQIEN
jgi:isopenicillin-N N-acyltransferase-like protein